MEDFDVGFVGDNGKDCVLSGPDRNRKKDLIRAIGFNCGTPRAGASVPITVCDRPVLTDEVLLDGRESVDIADEQLVQYSSKVTLGNRRTLRNASAT